MHTDAKSRLLELAANPRGPKTERAAIRALLPEIEAARAAGRTWAEIGAAMGVSRSTLFAALRVAKASVVSRPEVARVDSPEAGEARPPAEPGPKESKIKRWGV